jgi:hypothetical protein
MYILRRHAGRSELVFAPLLLRASRSRTPFSAAKTPPFTAATYSLMRPCTQRLYAHQRLSFLLSRIARARHTDGTRRGLASSKDTPSESRAARTAQKAKWRCKTDAMKSLRFRLPIAENSQDKEPTQIGVGGPRSLNKGSIRRRLALIAPRRRRRPRYRSRPFHVPATPCSQW